VNFKADFEKGWKEKGRVVEAGLSFQKNEL
jgi:hypothetical protein